MEKMRFYDEAAHNFYGQMEIKGYPLNSMDFFAQFFDALSKNLGDIQGLSQLASNAKWHLSANFNDEILKENHVVVVTDPQLNIVYATQNMVEMNGYQPFEVLGKKPKMFQGEATCRDTTKQVSTAIKKQESFEVTLTNYRKDGSRYECHIKSSPVFDRAGKLVNFIAFEKEVA
ncbi:PAS domain-containing protein [Flagellimonas myxillae]|uniref:PAS domain-containing protein n=1 Tax=Flagellimonas myxillae TaxID=2942214 RepID=UPI00201F769A|nr:PAS domain-containing protein [Muricauda myxillae]MCL6267355.1 PAS domain-containing protein [Muricauda myxillae]